MKRILSVLLALCLLCCLPAARAATEAADAFDFSFSVSLHVDALSEGLREHARGYADLLDALRLEGTFAHSRTSSCFELNLRVIPLNPDASPVELLLWGNRNYIFLKSPLLGTQELIFSSDSLLAFCKKAYRNLGIPLHYLGLLHPYVWTSAFGGLAAQWREAAGRAVSGDGTLSAGEIAALASDLEDSLNESTDLSLLCGTVGLDTGYNEDFKNLMYELPEYLKTQVAAGGALEVTRRDGEEIWSSAAGELASLSSRPDRFSLNLTLPPMSSGDLPVFSCSRRTDGAYQSGQCAARLLRPGAPEESLLDLRLSYASLPVSWPADCSSLVNLNLNGRLFANVGCSLFLRGEESGAFRAEIRKPSADSDPGPVLAEISGTLLPAEGGAEVPAFTRYELNRGIFAFSFGNASLTEFSAEVLPSLIPGVVRFLYGIPVSACQVVLDDLTESGVLGMIMNDR